MLSAVAPHYERLFGKSMQSDCDFSEKGPPILVNTGSLQPDHGPLSGGTELSISGGNYCEKRGVFVRFGEGGSVVRVRQIHKKKVVVDTPPMKARDSEFTVEFKHGEYEITLHRINKAVVECSNNRWEFSVTDPPQTFLFRESTPPYAIDESTSAGLLRVFSNVCSQDDRNNTKLMNRAKWRLLKKMSQLYEGQPGADEDIEPFFFEVAEYSDVTQDICLIFKNFLRVLGKTLLRMYGPETYTQYFAQVANTASVERKRPVDLAPRAEQTDIAIARRAIAMVERRSCQELDVFSGPVVCGVIYSRAGSVSSCVTGRAVDITKQHPFLTYTHYDVNTEQCILRHVQMSQSLPHLLQRLRQEGFDFAAHCSKLQTRKPAGRCWSIRGEQRILGCLWDYPGNVSCIGWQPAEAEMANPNATLMVYEESDSAMDFLVCYIQYVKAKSVQQLRTALESKGYVLHTKLYRAP